MIENNSGSCNTGPSKQCHSILVGIFCGLVGLLAVPCIIIFFSIFWLYRYIIHLTLKQRKGYCGLLTGSDAYWAIEKEESKSVINLLILLDFSKVQNPKECLLNILRTRLLAEGPKELRCKNVSYCGYSYWEEHDDDINIREYDFSNIERAISELSNQSLPNNWLWEVILAKKPLKNQSYYVLFRFHHCLGDGYAITKLFYEVLNDKAEIKSNSEKETSFIEKFKKVEVNKGILHGLFDNLLALTYAPFLIISQILLKPDENIIHTGIASGKKITIWRSIELKKLKKIKNYLNCSFTDAILFALANSLEFLDSKQVTIVITATIIRENVVKNGFSVAMLKISIPPNLSEIKNTTKKLKSMPDFNVNYWILRVLCGLLPQQLIQKAVKSRQGTLILSNVPGLGTKIKMNGCEIQDAVFWVPNRDSTGIGISILSYTDKVNIGIIADTGVIPSPIYANKIVDGIFSCFESLDLNM